MALIATLSFFRSTVSLCHPERNKSELTKSRKSESRLVKIELQLTPTRAIVVAKIVAVEQELSLQIMPKAQELFIGRS